MFLRSRFFRFENDSLATAQQLLSHCLAGSDNRFTIASRRTESGSFTRQNLSQLSAARNKPQYLGWGCSSAGEHFPRTEGVGRSNRLSSTIHIAESSGLQTEARFFLGHAAIKPGKRWQSVGKHRHAVVSAGRERIRRKSIANLLVISCKSVG